MADQGAARPSAAVQQEGHVVGNEAGVAVAHPGPERVRRHQREQGLPMKTPFALYVFKTRLISEETAHALPLSPAVQREACVGAESESFMQRVFRGASKPLLVHFAQNAQLTPEEVRELKSMLDQSLKNQS